jgi:predicted acylesterase/phospholipase RssA
MSHDILAPRIPARRERPAVAARSRPPRTAFVLAGGASLGALHAGMLQALHEREITTDLLMGTSAGALSAAYLASRAQTVETATALARVWRDLRREDIFPIHPPTLISGLANRSPTTWSPSVL